MSKSEAQRQQSRSVAQVVTHPMHNSDHVSMVLSVFHAWPMLQEGGKVGTSRGVHMDV